MRTHALYCSDSAYGKRALHSPNDQRRMSSMSTPTGTATAVLAFLSTDTASAPTICASAAPCRIAANTRPHAIGIAEARLVFIPGISPAQIRKHVTQYVSAIASL